MGGLDTCGRVLIVIVNIFIIILGFVMFGAGMVVKFGSSLLQPYINAVMTGLTTAFGNIDTSQFDLASIIGSLGVAILLIGLFMLIISITGCCGACCKVKPCILGYAILVGIVMISEIIIVILLFQKPELFNGPLKTELKASITADYMGYNGTNLVTLGFNLFHQFLSCCGVDNYNDFTGAPNWPTTSALFAGTLMAPMTCCKTLPTTVDTGGVACAVSPSAATSNYMSGCVTTVWNMIFGNVGAIAGAAAGTCVFMLILILFSVLIFYKLMKKGGKVNPH